MSTLETERAVAVAAEGVAIVDGQRSSLGEATIPVTDLGFLRGYAAFDTARAEGGELIDLDVHLDRFEASCAALTLGTIDRELYEREIREVSAAMGGNATIRFTLTGSGTRLVLGFPVQTGRFHKPVTAITGDHFEHPVVGGAPKHHSRLAWMVALKGKDADELFMVDENGRFTEGSTCSILAVIDGVLWTAPHDGRVLPSASCLHYLAEAERLGIATRLEGPPASGPWDALYVASTTRKLAPVSILDGRELPMWDPVGRRLAGLP